MRTNYPPKPCESHRLERPVDIHFIAVIACHTHFVRMAHATLADGLHVLHRRDWDAFSNVLPKDRHVIGKQYTVAIERDNSNTRHHLGRMTRCTKVASHCANMLDASLKLWLNLTTTEIFTLYQNRVLSIFK